MKFLKKIRESRKLTRYEMARLIGILPSTYYYYEDQAKGLSMDVLCLLRLRLGLSWPELGKHIDDEFDTLKNLEAEKPALRRKKRGAK